MPSSRCATGLAALGVRKGERVALVYPNTPAVYGRVIGGHAPGAVVVNTNSTYTAPELRHQLADRRRRTIVILNLFLPKLRAVQAELPTLKHVVLCAVDDMWRARARQLVRRAMRHEPDWVEPAAGPDTTLFAGCLQAPAGPPQVEARPPMGAVPVYGGTTGVPRAAMSTHGNLVANTLHAWPGWPERPARRRRMMCALPLLHVYGMTIGMLAQLPWPRT